LTGIGHQLFLINPLSASSNAVSPDLKSGDTTLVSENNWYGVTKFFTALAKYGMCPGIYFLEKHKTGALSVMATKYGAGLFSYAIKLVSKQ